MKNDNYEVYYSETEIKEAISSHMKECRSCLETYGFAFFYDLMMDRSSLSSYSIKCHPQKKIIPFDNIPPLPGEVRRALFACATQRVYEKTLTLSK